MAYSTADANELTRQINSMFSDKNNTVFSDCVYRHELYDMCMITGEELCPKDCKDYEVETNDKWWIDKEAENLFKGKM